MHRPYHETATMKPPLWLKLTILLKYHETVPVVVAEVASSDDVRVVCEEFEEGRCELWPEPVCNPR